MNQRRFLGLGISILGVLILSPALVGQVSKESEVGFPTDWSHHQLIFSKPATAEQAQRVQQDPRYWQQIARHSPATLREAETEGAQVPELQLGFKRGVGRKPKKQQGLWTEDLGSGATVGAANYPAKYNFRGTSANCAGGTAPPDFVVYGTGVAGSTTQASIVAYDNLYAGCTLDGPVPSVYWAYNTGGTVTTSPVLSGEGTQIAFVQRQGASSLSRLVLLKFAAGTGTVGTPDDLSRVSPSSYYMHCTAPPCMTTLPLMDPSGTYEEDSNSSIFYDYGQDTAYVGDNHGWLHKYNPVFRGVTVEVRTAGQWPVRVNPTAHTALTSPVYDSTSKNVFVADAGGFLYQVNSTGGVIQSGQLDFSTKYDSGPGIVQGPIVNSTFGLVYVFATSDGSKSCIGGSDCTAVYQLDTGFGAGDTGSKALVGASTVEPNTPNPLYIGAFDSTYENSVDATGNLYVCGNTGGPPNLYQIAIGGGVLGRVIAGPDLSYDTTPCSPVTDILNPNASGGATEWMFASAEGDGASTACDSGGCIFNFQDTPWLPSTVYAVGQEIIDSNYHIQFVTTPGGTSGASAPTTWNSSVGGYTSDNTVTWLDVGPLSAFPPAAWVPLNSYNVGAENILDGNQNLEVVTTGGTSGSSVTFNTVVGGTTLDGTVTWTNVGPPPTAALAATGGTSGIIIDNTVGSGTLMGASQIYFSTLTGGCGGTGDLDGCAVQASQSALQ
jgi:hypothetical protein